jgi:acetyl-CoA synthetase
MWFREYYRNPEKTGERFSGDGRWYYTGDVARRDADGDFFFASRDDDVILMAGYRIGPTDVESALLHHDAVAEAGVCAVPDEVRGEVIHAYCVLRAGVTPHEGLAEELREVVRQRYAAHAYPRRFHFVDSLPKTESGKVMRHRLRDMARAELAAGVWPNYQVTGSSAGRAKSISSSQGTSSARTASVRSGWRVKSASSAVARWTRASDEPRQ